MKTKTGKVNIHKYHSISCARIQVSDRVTIPAKVEMAIKATINGNYKDRLNILDPTHTFIDKGIFVARSLIDINDNNTIISVMNINSQPVKLETNTVLGSVSEISDVS